MIIQKIGDLVCAWNTTQWRCNPIYWVVQPKHLENSFLFSIQRSKDDPKRLSLFKAGPGGLKTARRYERRSGWLKTARRYKNILLCPLCTWCWWCLPTAVELQSFHCTSAPPSLATRAPHARKKLPACVGVLAVVLQRFPTDLERLKVQTSPLEGWKRREETICPQLGEVSQDCHSPKWMVQY